MVLSIVQAVRLAAARKPAKASACEERALDFLTMATSSSQANALRFPRDRFTRTLRKLFERLDTQGALMFDVAYTPLLSPRVAGRVEARVLGVWAVGSYARGAPTCGDLELLVDVALRWDGRTPSWDDPTRSNAPPDFSKVRKSIFGSYPHVSILDRRAALQWKTKDAPDGPLRPTFCMDTAVHLYGTEVDWRQQLDAIEIDPNAGHYPRMHDALPVRIEQTSMDVMECEELVEAKETGVLDWTFVPFEQRHASSSDLITREEKKYLGWHQRINGRMTNEVAPAALIATRHLRHLVWGESSDQRVFGDTTIQFRFGPARVSVSDFLSLQVHTVVLVPHWSARGPNGAWLVTVGPQHPHCIDLATTRAFLIGEGRVVYVNEEGYRFEGRDFYTSRKAAKESAVEYGFTEPIVELSGKPLRDALAGNALIQVDSCEYGVGLDHEIKDGPFSEPLAPASFEEVLRALGGEPRETTSFKPRLEMSRRKRSTAG